MTDNHKKPQKGKNRFNDAASEKPLTLANLTRRINAYEDDKNLQALLSSYSRNFLSEHEADLTALGGWVMDELDEVSAYSSHDEPPYIDPRKVIDGEMHGKVHVNKRFEAARQKSGCAVTVVRVAWPTSLPPRSSVAQVPPVLVCPSIRVNSGKYLSFTSCGAHFSSV